MAIFGNILHIGNTLETHWSDVNEKECRCKKKPPKMTYDTVNFTLETHWNHIVCDSNVIPM